MSEQQIARANAAIDTVLILVSAMSSSIPLMIAGLVVLLARRWSLFAAGVLAWAGVPTPAPAWLAVLLPGAQRLVTSSAAGVASGSEPARTSSEPPEPDLVRTQQNQLEPAEPAESPGGADSTEYDPVAAAEVLASDEQLLIAILAELRTSNGAYRWSANDITKFVGGTAAEVKAAIAARRPKAAPLPTRPPARVDRPATGW